MKISRASTAMLIAWGLSLAWTPLCFAADVTLSSGPRTGIRASGWAFRNQVGGSSGTLTGLNVSSTVPVGVQLSSAIAVLRGQGLQVPDQAALDRWMNSAFFRKLATEPYFKDSRKELLLENGQLKGIRFTHGGKTYTLIPPDEHFYVQDTPAAGATAQPAKVRHLKPDGTWEDVDLNHHLDSRPEALARFRAMSGLDPRLGSGLGTPTGPGTGTPGTGTSSFIDPSVLPSLNIVNQRTQTPTDQQVAAFPNNSAFWRGNDLWYKEAQGRMTKVGYQARMDAVAGSSAACEGSIIFWHGGAEPSNAGTHAQAGRYWALYFQPNKPPEGFEIVEGNNTARHIGMYSAFTLTGAQTQTVNGVTRLNLWTALKPYQAYESPGAASATTQYLFQYASAPGGLKSYIGMDGYQYVDRQENGATRIVRTGRIFSTRRVGDPGSAPIQEDRPLTPPTPPVVTPSTGTGTSVVPSTGSTTTRVEVPPAVRNLLPLTPGGALRFNPRYTTQLDTLLNYLKDPNGDPVVRAQCLDSLMRGWDGLSGMWQWAASGQLWNSQIKAKMKTAFAEVLRDQHLPPLLRQSVAAANARL